MSPVLPFAIGAAPGLVCSLYLARGWAQERLQRCRADRRAAGAMLDATAATGRLLWMQGQLRQAGSNAGKALNAMKQPKGSRLANDKLWREAHGELAS
jgi:hypothetical protein